MAQRKRRKKETQDDYPGWMWMLFGLAIGLSVAFAIYQKDLVPVQTEGPVTPQPASMAESLSPAEAPAEVSREPEEETTESRFTFYEDLMNFEVVIPEQKPDVSEDAIVEAVQEPGRYVLQAGSFSALADADRRRAQLALQGVESRIQRVAIDEKTYHRVWVGPIADLDELNRIRAQLRQAKIDVLRIRLGD